MAGLMLHVLSYLKYAIKTFSIQSPHIFKHLASLDLSSILLKYFEDTPGKIVESIINVNFIKTTL